MGITAIVAAVGGGLDQFPSDTMSFRSATSSRFGLHLGKQSSDFIDRHAFSTNHILLVLLRGCDFGCNVYKLRIRSFGIGVLEPTAFKTVRRSGGLVQFLAAGCGLNECSQTNRGNSQENRKLRVDRVDGRRWIDWQTPRIQLEKTIELRFSTLCFRPSTLWSLWLRPGSLTR